MYTDFFLLFLSVTVKVCPHAGGVGLCEMVQHLQMWDYVALSGTSEGKYVEYVDQQHEHFVNPTVVKNAHYIAPRVSRKNVDHHTHEKKNKFIVKLDFDKINKY